ncbi:Putative phosphoserine phosphatase 2 [Fundidesulfovibrio magnetotacticus]|uniref:Phosphoserine phosphatase 2 n=1 Tax=Fundidesulfovibrio magnetotacticus TaxID=2730080 RepID=A0A6V8LKS0_9BACT|nr:histidine phosphatase family protein [Fundidesulfovibrio magnetotacticus]GFK93293.1 Putative phosphoserine phosphatase 2 [Fundidesulfovibrio magnetotacticus]
MTRIGIIRHARTQWNNEGRIQGRSDSPVTPQGLASARFWAATLEPFGFSALYSSPLGRAMATSRALGRELGLEPRPLPGVEEQDFGEWTGRKVADLREEGLLSLQEALGWAFTPPGGESRAQLLARSWDALLRLARSNQDQPVLVVAHEGVVRALVYALLGRDYLPWEPRILAPRALHVLEAREGCLRLAEWNVPL